MNRLPSGKLEAEFRAYAGNTEKTDVLIREQSEIENTALIHYLPRKSARRHAIASYLERSFPEAPPLNTQNTLLEPVEHYYQSTAKNKTAHLDNIIDAIIPREARNQLIPNGWRPVYRRSAEICLQHFPQEPLKTIDVPKVVHSFDVAHQVALLPTSQPQDVLCATVHDLLEDTNYGRAGGGTEAEEIERAATVLAKECMKELGATPANEHQEAIAIACTATARLSLNSWLYDYVSYLENLGEVQETPEIMLSAHKRVITESIYTANYVKSQDKRRGMSMSRGMTVESLCKLEGKVMATILVLEEYESLLRKLGSKNKASSIDHATRALCATTYFELEEDTEKIQKLMNYTVKAPTRYKRQGIGGRPRAWNAAFDDGLLSRIDPDGLVVDLLSFGYRKPRSGKVSPLLKHEHETDEEAKARLRKRNLEVLEQIPGDLCFDNLQSKIKYNERLRSMNKQQRRSEYLGLQQLFNMNMLLKHAALAGALFPHHQFKRASGENV